MHVSAAAVVASLVLAGSAFAQVELYFAEYEYLDGRVRAMQLNGSGLRTLFSLPAQEWLPVGLEVDVPAAKLYWSDMWAPNDVFRANLDGSALQQIVAASSSTRGPRFDGAGKLYYTDGNTLRRANLDGSSNQLLFTASQTWPLSAPAVDGTNGHVYFGADKSIRRMDLDGANVITVVRGVSSVRDVELDIGAGYVYWLDADTISDFVGRVKLDGTDFTVLVDNSPNVVQSGGLISLLVDRGGGSIYFADDLSDRIERTDLNGQNRTLLYASPTNHSPSALALSTGRPPQALADCNANGIADRFDIAGGTSSDCNSNGVPDECEAAPCPSYTYLVDQGSNPSVPSLTLGGPAPGVQFEIFSPIDVPSGGWNVDQIALDGFTANYGNGSGFTATLFPDDGSGAFANEALPLAAVVGQFRFDPDNVNWLYHTFNVSLPAGRHWLRLSSNHPGVYFAAANVGTSGPGTLSRRGDGVLFANSPLALRITAGCAAPQSYCTSKLSSHGCSATMSSGGTPTPSGNFVVSTHQVEGQRAGLVFRGTNGPFNAPFQGGFLCVAPPLSRLPVQFSGGTAGTCTGSFSSPLTSLVTSVAPGSTFWMQAWFRDPQSPSTTGLSNGLRFTTCP
ncbi:MAG: hypothetical protein IT454_16140 [Planctomycetes bacterium]|nr:hypothetical protein [Planctomycetota bacterium]